MGGVQFAAGTGLAVWTLRKQHNDSIAQREGEWFHLVVADKTVNELHTMVENEAIELDSSERRCIAAKTGGATQPVIDQCFRNEIQNFRARVAPVRRRVSHFAFGFDRGLYLDVSRLFQDLEDKVAEWFDRLQREGPADPREGLMEIVCDSQRELLNSFRTFEFDTLPASASGLAKRRRTFWVFSGITFAAMLIVTAALAIAHAQLAFNIAGKQTSLSAAQIVLGVTIIVGFSLTVVGYMTDTR